MMRVPAHPGQTLRPLQFLTLDDELAARLRLLTGAERVERALHPVPAPVGYYRLSKGHLGDRVFAKIVPTAQTSRQWAASQLSDAAAKTGLPALRSLAEPLVLDEAHAILQWPWVDGRFTEGSQEDLISLGAAMRDLHRFLRELATPVWQARGRCAWKATWQSMQRLAASGTLDQDLASALDDLLQHPHRTEAVLWADAQPIHDDLHRGNVLFGSDGRVLAFLDFEEALDSFASPWVDLSWIVERFCTPPPGTAPVPQSMSAFLRAYGRPAYDAGAAHCLGVATRWRNFRALAVLQGLDERPDHWQQEWQKFCRFVRAAL